MVTDESSCIVPRFPHWSEFPQGKKVCISISKEKISRN